MSEFTVPVRQRHFGKAANILAVVILLIVLVFVAFTTIPAGSRGVLLTWGKADPSPIQPGLKWRWPIAQTIVRMPVTIQRSETKGEAASSDLQRVNTTVVLNYHVEPSKVVSVYTTIGTLKDVEPRIIDPAVQEAMKAVTARYNAEELITKRPDVAGSIHQYLVKRLARNHIVIDEFSITDFRFSPEFDQAIEQKTVAEQRVLTEQRNLQRIKVEAEQKVAKAKGEADSVKINAAAQAEALRLQRQQVTPELVQLREVEAQMQAIDKWDGKLPTVTGGAMPFVDAMKAQSAH